MPWRGFGSEVTVNEWSHGPFPGGHGNAPGEGGSWGRASATLVLIKTQPTPINIHPGPGLLWSMNWVLTRLERWAPRFSETRGAQGEAGIVPKMWLCHTDWKVPTTRARAGRPRGSENCAFWAALHSARGGGPGTV